MRAYWVVPIIASILILGTLGFSQNVTADLPELTEQQQKAIDKANKAIDKKDKAIDKANDKACAKIVKIIQKLEDKGETVPAELLELQLQACGPEVAIDCTFTTDSVKKIMKLDADCTTDATITIPDGWTLDGKKKTITAIDPAAGPFIGGVVENAGATAHVKNLKITSAITNFDCKSGNDRFRGIFFDEVSGSIEKNEVSNIHKDGGCQEGNGIEVRNPPFVGFGCDPEVDDCHPATETVKVSKNTVTNYGKTGIVANGDVFVIMEKNKIGESGFQTSLAANSIQCAFGAKCDISKNNIDGNQWCGGPTDDVATAVLLFGAADGSTIVKNKIGGNSDVGINLTGAGPFPTVPITEMATVEKNKLDDKGEDCPNSTADIGINDDGTTNTLTKNKFKGFTNEIGTESSPVAP